MTPLPLLLLGAGERVPLWSVFVVLQIHRRLPLRRRRSVNRTRLLVALLSIPVVLQTLTSVGVFADRSHSLVQC